MKIPYRQKSRSERDELLDGFADSELDSTERREVEQRLSQDAWAANALAEQGWVTRLWRNDAEPIPDETTWARVFTGIEASLEPAPTPQILATTSSHGRAPNMRVDAGMMMRLRRSGWMRGATRWAGAAAAP